MDGNKISEKETDWSEAVDSRQLQSGNWTEQASSGSVERMLFHLYCQGHFFNVTRNGNEKKLNYEMEYLNRGKNVGCGESESGGPAIAFNTGRNKSGISGNRCTEKSGSIDTGTWGYICSGKSRTGRTGETAILAAWAYAESVSDVRILLDGGHVSLRKTEAQWRTSLEHVGDCLNASADETSREGLGYESYLQILLWTVSEEK